MSLTTRLLTNWITNLLCNNMARLRIKDKSELTNLNDSDGFPFERDGTGQRWIKWSNIIARIRSILISTTVGNSTTKAPSEKAVSDAIAGLGAALNGNRPIKALPSIGQVPGGTTAGQVINNIYWPFLPATISLNAFPLQEVGSTYAPVVVGTITPRDETSITDRRVLEDDLAIHSLSTNNVNYTAPAFTVAFGNNKKYRIAADVGGDGTPGVVLSPERTVEGIYPYLYGASDNPDLTGSGLYSLSKLMQKEGNKEVVFNGTDKYFYFAFHEDYDDLSQIIDQNGFSLSGFLASKQIKSVTSVNGWTQNYKVYRSGLTTINSGAYKFNK